MVSQMSREQLQIADETLRRAHAALSERNRLIEIREAIAPDLLEAERELAPLEAAASKELKDVERYQSGAWAFVYDVFRDREARLTKEQREAALAQARAAEQRALRDRLAEELASLDRRIAALRSAEVDLAAARAGKQAALVASGHPSAAELVQIDTALAAADRAGIELAEALAAGERVHATLTRLLEALGSAANYSSADLVMNSMLISMLKRDHMDRAHALAGSTQAELTVFQRELGDIGHMLESELAALAAHQRFIDVLFDNIFSDWSVHGMIGSAQAQAHTVRQVVADRLGNLRAQRAEVSRQQDELSQRRARILG